MSQQRQTGAAEATTGTDSVPASPLSTWLSEAGALMWCWLKIFLVTAAIFLALAIVLGLACFWIMPGGWEQRSAVGGVILILCAAIGVLLAPHRATSAAGSLLVLRHRLASRVVEYLFQAYSEDDSRVAVAAGKLPLAEAETKLRHYVAAMRLDKLTVGPMTRWIVRKVHARLIRQIERYTLAEYRREAAQGGMVDLKLVQGRLAGRIDQEIADRISAGPKRLVQLALLGSVILSLGSCLGYRLLAWSAAAPPAPATMPATVATQIDPEA